MFTNRFIKIQIIIYNRKQEEIYARLPWECDRMQVERRLNPFEIESYSPAHADGSDFGADVTWMTLRTKSGDAVIVPMSVTEFEKLLNDFSNDRT